MRVDTFRRLAVGWAFSMTAPAVVPRSHPRLAFALSVACHSAIGLALWIAGTGALDVPVALARSAPPRVGWQQLRGESKASAGRNQLFDVLSAPDAVRVRLTSATRGVAATGLAWWRPSRGLWFAADGFPSTAAGRTLQLWLLLPNQRPISPGTVEIDAGGSGRMLAINDAAIQAPPDAVVTILVTETRTLLSFARSPAVVLMGQARSKTLRR